ncbi:MAG TPA: PIN domain-containing protein [Acidobacteriota bacterium]|nr:PIN domain-containing protein [Acidobacteriota bacterium]
MKLPRRLFCDTSFFYACLDPSDQHCESAIHLLKRAAESGSTLVTTWDIVSETVTLLRYRHSFDSARMFLDEVKPTLELVHYGDATRREAEEIFRTYGSDHRLSFCDAISFVIVTTLLDHVACLSFDRAFRALGLTVLDP